MDKDHSPSYLRTARQIAGMIHSGTIQATERLPSLRQISRQHNISLATALQAYRWLEDHELVVSRPGSGFYVAGNRSIGTYPEWLAPAANHVSPIPRATDAMSPDWRLPCAPSTTLMPGRRISRIIGSMARRYPLLITDIGPASGDPELRRQIARWSMAHGCERLASDIVITAGGIEAITLALRSVTAPGDTIAVESPCSPAILNIAGHSGLRAVEVTTMSDHGIHLDALETTLDAYDIKACLFSTNCADPVGYVMSDDHKHALMRLLERRAIPLIENDILGDLAYGERPRPASCFAESDNTLVCSSFTYTLGSGLRLGWIAPGRYMPRVLELKAASSVTPPILLQRSVAEYLRGNGFDRHLRTLRRALKYQSDWLSKAVEQYLPQGSRVHHPEGGAALWIELPSPIDTEVLTREVQSSELEMVPGARFTTGRDYGHFMRLTCGEPWRNGRDAHVRALGIRAAAILAQTT